jgi:hypothetical protein
MSRVWLRWDHVPRPGHRGAPLPPLLLRPAAGPAPGSTTPWSCREGALAAGQSGAAHFAHAPGRMLALHRTCPPECSLMTSGLRKRPRWTKTRQPNAVPGTPASPLSGCWRRSVAVIPAAHSPVCRAGSSALCAVCIGVPVIRIYQGRLAYPRQRWLKAAGSCSCCWHCCCRSSTAASLVSTDATTAVLLAGLTLKLLEMQRSAATYCWCSISAVSSRWCTEFIHYAIDSGDRTT